MANLKRWRRRALMLLGFLGVLATILVGGLKWYLGSSAYASLLAAQLSRTLGSQVRLESAFTPLFGQTQLTGLSVHEAGNSETLFAAGRLVANTSAYRALVRGPVPTEVQIVAPRLRLRFDKDGQLLSRLPTSEGSGDQPALSIVEGVLSLEQQGRTPFVLSGLTLQMTPSQSGAAALNGSLDDPTWGQFDLTGQLVDGQLSLKLTTSRGRINLAMLRSLPFVPADVWQYVEFQAADMPLTFSLTVGSQAPHVRYQLDFAGLTGRLPQPDRPALVVRSVSGRLEGTENGFACRGQIQDDYWGNWQAQVRQEEGQLRIELDTPDVKVDPKKLRQVPYVPLFVWDQISAEGRTPVRLKVRLPSDRPEVYYRVELNPRDTQVRIAAIDLTVQRTSGVVIVENHQVRLQSVKGQAGGGSLTTTADMDFRTTPTQLRFHIEVRQLVLRQLPALWELPRQIDGKISGAADVVLKVGERIETSGSGKGQIDEATLVGFRTREPIGLTLQVERGRFRFLPRTPLIPGTAQETEIRLDQPLKQVDHFTGELTRAVGAFGQAVNQTTSQALSSVAQFERRLWGKETTILEAEVVLDQVDLAELLCRAEIELPYPVEGELSLRVRLGIPVNTPNDLKAYRLRGRVRGSALRFADVYLERVRALVWLDQGVLSLDEFEGRLALEGSGRLTGSATLQLAPLGDLVGELQVEEVCLEQIAGRSTTLAGVLSGRTRFRSPISQLSQPEAWQGQACLHGPLLHFAGVSIQNGSLDAVLRQGRLSVTDVRAKVLGGLLTGQADLDLRGQQPFQAQFRLRGGDLAVAGAGRHLPLRGSFGLEGGFQGNLAKLDPREPIGSGWLSGIRVHCAGVPVTNLSLGWALTPQQFRLTHLRAGIGGGTLEGFGDIPLQQGQGQVRLKLTGLDLEQLVRGAPSLQRQLLVLGVRPSGLQGQITGQVQSTILSKAGRWSVRSSVALNAPDLSLAGTRFRRLNGQIDQRDDTASYSLQGELFGGRLSVEGKYPPPPRGASSQPDGMVRLERVYLGRLFRELLGTTATSDLRGVASIVMPFRLDGPGMQPVGDGWFELRDVRWQGVELSDQFRGNLRLSADKVLLREASGSLAGGQLQIKGGYYLQHQGESWFHVRVVQADASQLPVVGGEHPILRGRMDLLLRGQGGPQWRAIGELNLARGRVYGVSISEMRIPLEAMLAGDTGQAELQFQEFSTQVGQGRARGHLALRWADTLRLEGRIQLLGASLSSLAGLLGDVSNFARGRVSGWIELGSPNLRSLNDLNARVQAKLRSAQALQVAVLQQVTPYLLPGQGSNEFSTGDLEGHMAGGVFRIRKFTLESSLLQLLIQGSITVQGRLDLSVTGQSSARTTQPLMLGALFTKIPLVGPLPLSVVVRATQMLAERLVRVRVSGTVRAPVVQIEPIRLLDEDAIRFFLGQSSSSR